MNIRKIASFSLGPVLGAFLGFITLPLIAWIFPKEDIGRFSMYQAVLGFGVMLFSLALHQAYVREYQEMDNKGLLLKLTILPGVLLFVLVSLVFFVFPLSLSIWVFDLQSVELDMLIMLGLLFSFLINILKHVLRMQERGMAFSVAEVMPRISHLIFIVIFVVAFYEYGFKELVLSNVIALAITLTALVYLVRADIRQALSAEYDRKTMQAMLTFSLPLVAGSLAYWALTTMDRFFLRILAGFDELALYSVAVSIAAVAAVLSTIFSNLWHPVVYRWVSEGVQMEKVQAVIDFMLLGILAVWSLFGAFSWVISYLLPNEYLSIQYLVVACVSMPLLYMLSEATVIGVGITRRSVFSMSASLLALFANLLLNYLLIPKYGAAGAAIASALSFSLFFAIRTEASCYVWRPIRRLHMYILVICYLSFTILFALQEVQYPIVAVGLWLFLLLLTMLLLNNRVRQLFDIVKDKVASKC
ncbi:lipopolysaccharide biosynthesis protein [Billgrantia sp. C5P2]|uniref:lipopolysaccharide biosynthesis protein n=1 Tax=Billgrantia sp. C5P2 TaxID=3436239 RepID=UPI003DA34CB0